MKRNDEYTHPILVFPYLHFEVFHNKRLLKMYFRFLYSLWGIGIKTCMLHRNKSSWDVDFECELFRVFDSNCFFIQRWIDMEPYSCIYTDWHNARKSEVFLTHCDCEANTNVDQKVALQNLYSAIDVHRTYTLRIRNADAAATWGLRVIIQR